MIALLGYLDGLAHDRVDASAPALAAENAVVTGTGLHVMRLQIRAQSVAKVVRSERLPQRADVVALSFDREQGSSANGAEIDLAPAPRQYSFGQRVLLKHQAHGLEVKLRRQIAHREVFFVEHLGRVGSFGFVVDEIVKQVAKRIEMTIEIHAHERHELQKSRIDAA